MPATDGSIDINALRASLQAQARRRAGNADEAEDLVQECLEVLLARQDTIRKPSSVISWCGTVLLNLFRQRLRRRWYTEVLGLQSLPEDSFDRGQQLTRESWYKEHCGSFLVGNVGPCTASIFAVIASLGLPRVRTVQKAQSKDGFTKEGRISECCSQNTLKGHHLLAYTALTGLRMRKTMWLRPWGRQDTHQH